MLTSREFIVLFSLNLLEFEEVCISLMPVVLKLGSPDPRRSTSQWLGVRNYYYYFYKHMDV